jgi:S1-C subfamily serine protease
MRRLSERQAAIHRDLGAKVASGQVDDVTLQRDELAQLERQRAQAQGKLAEIDKWFEATRSKRMRTFGAVGGAILGLVLVVSLLGSLVNAADDSLDVAAANRSVAMLALVAEIDQGGSTKYFYLGGGSAFAWKTPGYLVTNRHNIEARDAQRKALPRQVSRVQMYAIFGPGESYPVDEVHVSPTSDMAVLHIPKDGWRAERPSWPHMDVASLDEVKVNQPIWAIGFPVSAIAVNWKPADIEKPRDSVLAIFSQDGDLSHTVTTGILSKPPSPTDNGSTYGRVIQTQADLKGANSGGPQVEVQGRVVGISTY